MSTNEVVRASIERNAAEILLVSFLLFDMALTAIIFQAMVPTTVPTTLPLANPPSIDTTLYTILMTGKTAVVLAGFGIALRSID